MPNCFRSAGTIGPGLVLAALALAGLRRDLAALAGHFAVRPVHLEISRRVADGERSYAFRVRCDLALLPLLLVGLLLVHEYRETERFYFVDFRQYTPDVANYSIAQQLARHIAAYQDGTAYVKGWPHWYDGRAVNAHLDALGQRPVQEIHEIGVNLPPLAGFRGRLLVLLHPQDTTSLEILKGAFSRWAVKVERAPNNMPAIVAFYGER